MQRGHFPYRETCPVLFGDVCHWERHGLPLACRFFQQAAGVHATRLGVGLDVLRPQGLSWVLSAVRLRRECAVPTPATFTLETGPTGAVSRVAHRDFLGFADAAENACILGSSRWMMVRTDNGRPVAMPQAVRDLVPEPHPPALLEVPTRLPPVAVVACERTFAVRRYDLDLNVHANNVHLIEMAVESVPDAVWQGGALDELTVVFRTAAVYGDALRGVTQVTATAAGWDVVHALTAVADGREILQAQSAWVRP